MENKQKKPAFPIQPVVNALVVTVLLSVGGTLAVLYADRPTVSEIEKRALTPLPEFSVSALIHGQYTRQLSAYFADTFPAREAFVLLTGALREHRGFRFNDVLLYEGAQQETVIDRNLPLLPEDTAAALAVLPAPQQQEHEAPNETAPDPNTADHQDAAAESAVYPPPASSSAAALSSLPLPTEDSVLDSVEEGVRMGAIFTYNDSGYTIFGGSNRMGQWYAQVLNAYQQVLGGHIKLYNIVVPSAIEFNLPARYQSVTTPQKPKIENIAALLDPAICWVDVYDTLSRHKDDYLYYRTDHHWSTLGAYYAYVEFARAAGFEPLPLEQMEKRTLDDFLGTIYSQTQNSRMASNPDHVDYYIMPTAYKCYQYRKGAPDTAIRVPLYGEYAKSYNSYSVFMHGDFPVTVVDTERQNGRRIAVVKESFGNAFVPFLVNHYESVVIIDQRYLEKGFYGLLEEFEINELLFINNIAAAHTAVRIQELASLPNRIYIPPVIEEVSAEQDGAAQAAHAQAQPAAEQNQEKS